MTCDKDGITNEIDDYAAGVRARGWKKRKSDLPTEGRSGAHSRNADVDNLLITAQRCQVERVVFELGKRATPIDRVFFNHCHRTSAS